MHVYKCLRSRAGNRWRQTCAWFVCALYIGAFCKGFGGKVWGTCFIFFFFYRSAKSKNREKPTLGESFFAEYRYTRGFEKRAFINLYCFFCRRCRCQRVARARQSLVKQFFFFMVFYLPWYIEKGSFLYTYFSSATVVIKYSSDNRRRALRRKRFNFKRNAHTIHVQIQCRSVYFFWVPTSFFHLYYLRRIRSCCEQMSQRNTQSCMRINLFWRHRRYYWSRRRCRICLSLWKNRLKSLYTRRYIAVFTATHLIKPRNRIYYNIYCINAASCNCHKINTQCTLLFQIQFLCRFEYVQSIYSR